MSSLPLAPPLPPSNIHGLTSSFSLLPSPFLFSPSSASNRHCAFASIFIEQQRPGVKQQQRRCLFATNLTLLLKFVGNRTLAMHAAASNRCYTASSPLFLHTRVPDEYGPIPVMNMGRKADMDGVTGGGWGTYMASIAIPNK
ncbi:hypothetical protein PIB30_018697 [Stylosanthes scabra]|uniref:Uncharacterized protein n=1 Tax=Stylosanthes scabra TaxID=79078 RepID=A0ABU6W7J9_9FABA|nr:hypothetical protein [Stylosanthes scabra]